MRFKRRYGVNVETILRLIFLLGFTIFYYSTIRTDTVYNYVHPRVIPYIIFAMISFIIISILSIDELFRIRRKDTKMINYIIFLIPLLIAFIIPAKTIIPESISLNIANAEGIPNVKFKDGTSYMKNNTRDEDFDLDISPEIADLYTDIINNRENKFILEGDKISINNDNFIDWLDRIYMNTERYEGKTVEIIGFVLKDWNYKKNEFIIARFMMVCCAADTQAVGFLCDYDKAPELEEGSWIKIKGMIQNKVFNDEEKLILRIESLETVNKPANEFIYPY